MTNLVPSDNCTVLHIGYSKCASTFLQQEIFPRVPGYIFHRKDQNIIFPLLFNYYEENADIFDAQKFRNGRHIISDERFLQGHKHPSHRYNVGHHEEIGIANLSRLFSGAAEFLIVIRRQDNLAESFFRPKAEDYLHEINFFIDFPRTRSKIHENSITLKNRNGKYYLRGFDYYIRVMDLASQFGKGHVHVLLYEELETNLDAFIQRLENVFMQDLSSLRKFFSQRRNVSPRVDKIIPRYLRPIRGVVRRVIPKDVSLKRIVPKRKLEFSDKYKAALLEEYKEGNRLLAKVYDLPMEKFGYW